VKRPTIFNGRSGDIDLLLWPINFSLAYVGYDVLKPFVAYGVEAGLRYSSKDETERRLVAVADDLKLSLDELAARKTVPFNQMADWGADGRIVPDAPSHSPFMRHRLNLDLD
jgi:NAD(P)H dehydrogenase (quinone)